MASINDSSLEQNETLVQALCVKGTISFMACDDTFQLLKHQFCVIKIVCGNSLTHSRSFNLIDVLLSKHISALISLATPYYGFTKHVALTPVPEK